MATLELYQHIPIQENNEPLVDLEKFGFVLDRAYFKEGLTTESQMFLRQSVAEKLAQAQESLESGYKIKIFDGFRPTELQKRLFQRCFDDIQAKNPDWTKEQVLMETEIYAADVNRKGEVPPHSTGGAVDLTLVDREGRELDMGTPNGHLGPEAAPMFFEQDKTKENICLNRKLLRETLQAQGFVQYNEEWWHFDFGDQIWALYLNKPFAIYGTTAAI